MGIFTDYCRNRRWFLVSLVFLAIVFSCSKSNRQSLPPSMIPEADYVGMETCAMCHAETVESFELTIHSRMSFPGQDDQEGNPTCESCHGAGSLHFEAGGGRGVHIIDPVETPEACFQCHQGTEAEFNLQYHHPLVEGRMDCMTCHDPHGKNIFSPVGRKLIGRDDSCRQCHMQQARPHVFTHEALRDGCTVCHSPHGGINDKLLVERDNNLCLKCHAQIMPAGEIAIGAQDHTNFLAEGTCWSAGCHTAVHGSNINPHLRY